MSQPALSVRNFGVGFGDRVILSDVTFDLPAVGMTVLVGPAGGGKSTLLRTLAGLNDCHPSLVTWGSVAFDGVEQSAARREARQGTGRPPALVMQHARFYLDTVRENLVSALPNRAELAQIDQTRVVVARLEASGLGTLAAHIGRNAVELPLALQRRLAIARAVIALPSVLFADEPTAGLDDDEAMDLTAMLRAQAEDRAVLLVTHNQRCALAAGGTTLLLANGRIQERARTSDFFQRPGSEAARHFLRTGGCLAPSVEVASEQVKESAPLPSTPSGAREPSSRFVGPRGFYWVIPGQLGGMPRPGIIGELDHDLDGLERLGVTVVVTLEEERTLSEDALSERGMRSFHFPVVDMGVPETKEAAAGLCRTMDGWLRRGDVVALHCRAGLGRTGTLLACQLIWAGANAREAVEALRAINARCIQSDAQIEFLRSFASWLQEDAAPRSRESQLGGEQ